MTDKQSEGQLSGLHFYSIGVAAANLPLVNESGEPETRLAVTPREQMFMHDGELVALPFESEAAGKDAEGNDYSAKVTLDTAITATWLPMNSNRITPPNIRRGERVIIWRYGDTDEYRWTETGWDDHLRRLETVKYRFSAVADEDADGTAEENAYWLMISTHLGLITLRTAVANKEKAQFELQINARDGIAVLADSHGNLFQIESVAKTVSLKNGDGTTWMLDKKQIVGYAEDLLFLETGNSINFKTKDIVFDCTNFTVNGQTATLNCAQTFIKGQLTVDGETIYKSKVTFEGPVTMQQHLSANGISSPKPISGPSDTI